MVIVNRKLVDFAKDNPVEKMTEKTNEPGISFWIDLLQSFFYVMECDLFFIIVDLDMFSKFSILELDRVFFLLHKQGNMDVLLLRRRLWLRRVVF